MGARLCIARGAQTRAAARSDPTGNANAARNLVNSHGSIGSQSILPTLNLATRTSSEIQHKSQSRMFSIQVQTVVISFSQPRNSGADAAGLFGSVGNSIAKKQADL